MKSGEGVDEELLLCPDWLLLSLLIPGRVIHRTCGCGHRLHGHVDMRFTGFGYGGHRHVISHAEPSHRLGGGAGASGETSR